MTKSTDNKDFSALLKNKILSKKAIIGIIGLGYVGLPLSILIAKKKFKIVGFDNDKIKINKIKKGKSYFARIQDAEIKILKKNNFFYTNYRKISKCDIIVICLPTPLDNDNKPNLSFIKNTFKKIKNSLKEGQLIILESTSYPGTTREELVHKLNNKFLIGENLFIGFSSERINPGDNENNISHITKVASGYSNDCKKLVNIFYKMFFKKMFISKTLEEAEFSKILENVFRSVNIALINEMKLISQKLKINLFNVINAASTKPYGFMRFEPGPGIGGHCIPIDPYYLYWRAKKKGFDSEFIKLSAKLNINTTENIYKKINDKFKNKKKTKLIILGLSYKKNIEDTRESPAIQILCKLSRFFKVDYSDPYVKKFPRLRRYKLNLKSVKLTTKNLKKYDAAILITDHDNFNYPLILKYSKIIFDTRNAFNKFNNDKVISI